MSKNLQNMDEHQLKAEIKDLLFDGIFKKSRMDDIKPLLSDDEFNRLSSLAKTLNDMRMTEKSSKDRERLVSENYIKVHVHKLYPFKSLRIRSLFVVLKKLNDGTFLYGDTFARRNEGYYFSDSYEEAKNESFADVVEKSNFLTREEFGRSVLGPLLGIPGEIFSTIPKEERFKIIAHYQKPWKDSMGFNVGNETQLAHVDILTGGGIYFGGSLVDDIKKDVSDVLAADTVEQSIRALQEFSFFYKRENETFILLDEVPNGWRNINDGKLIDDSKERNLSHWRNELLKKYGFENVDFSKLDKEM